MIVERMAVEIGDGSGVSFAHFAAIALASAAIESGFHESGCVTTGTVWHENVLLHICEFSQSLLESPLCRHSERSEESR